ncbi:ROK family protein [Peterkaempfera sp. SMS 1(5)a]|uniref:ROK family protein n=1 Tax=Peterkaempfera podocarpi TaxID=3232308 RepID=UPI00366E582E
MDATQRVRSAVETSDGTTRADLATELGLPLGTVTTAVAGLLRSGVLTEQPAPPTGPRSGRPAMLLIPAGPSRTVGAVVWAHGRLRTAVATYGGTVLARGDMAVTGDGSSPDVLEPAWRFLDEAGLGPLDRVVLGVPAPFQRGVGLPPGRLPVPGPSSPGCEGASARRSGFAPWLHPDPAAALAQRLGVPVVIENDANLGALGEAHSGVGLGRSCQIFLKLGERSVGAGLVLDGALHRGASGFAGEIAHIHADDDGPLCACGARGCLSSRARRPLVELMEEAYDRPLTFTEVLRLADADEPAPARVLREVGRTLGRPLADLCTFLDPDLLILDGALGGAGRHVLSGLAEQIERCCAPAVAASLSVVQGTLGSDAEILGAIRLARTEALASD